MSKFINTCGVNITQTTLSMREIPPQKKVICKPKDFAHNLSSPGMIFLIIAILKYNSCTVFSKILGQRIIRWLSFMIMPIESFGLQMTMNINFSSRTTSLDVQRNLESVLEKRTKDTYGPPIGKKIVCFIDDLNMPQVSYNLLIISRFL
jgi:hypothetical protein